jgi:cutinase
MKFPRLILPVLFQLSLVQAMALTKTILTRELATSSTQNDILSSTPCKVVTVIFARGTTEAGNVGSVAGPPFFSALATKIGASNLAV